MKPWIAALVVCGLWSGVSADSPTPAKAEATAQQVLDARYQRDATRPAPPPAQVSKAERNMAPKQRRQTRDAGGGMGAIIWVVLAIVVILAIVAVVLSPTTTVLSAQLAEPDAGPKAPGPAVIHPTPKAALERPLQTAEQLAAAGRFAEAIHTLLGQTLNELNVAANRGIKASETSREIAKQVTLAPAPGQALVGLINAVERTHFGDDVPTAEDYATCRAQFEIFVKTYKSSPRQGGRA